MVVEVESDDMQRVVEAGVLMRSLWKVEEKKGAREGKKEKGG
jgi:hypothetical protein